MSDFQEPTPKQAQFGNAVIEVVHKSVKERGIKKAMILALPKISHDAAQFIKLIPGCGEPGQTLVIDEEFFKAFQDFITAMAVLGVLGSELVGDPLEKLDIPPEN